MASFEQIPFSKNTLQTKTYATDTSTSSGLLNKLKNKLRIEKFKHSKRVSLKKREN